jgi:hypothetical protein
LTLSRSIPRQHENHSFNSQISSRKCAKDATVSKIFGCEGDHYCGIC